jgi:hypothetical protein
MLNLIRVLRNHNLPNTTPFFDKTDNAIVKSSRYAMVETKSYVGESPGRSHSRESSLSFIGIGGADAGFRPLALAFAVDCIIEDSVRSAVNTADGLIFMSMLARSGAARNGMDIEGSEGIWQATIVFAGSSPHVPAIFLP